MQVPRTASQVLGLTFNGRYRATEPLSAGAMGAVYRAVDLETNREVALKQSTNPLHDQRFEAEARLLATLQHPRIVKVIDHFASASGQYLVMELVHGIELGALLKQRGSPGLPVDQAITYVRQACEGLQYVHSQQIVHRDVKPQNLILGEQGVVVVDFGIARLLGDDDEVEDGTVGIGTPRFMAPEVFAGGRVSPRTDVFGIAATLWTLICGKPPRYADQTKLCEAVPDVTLELERTIAAGLEMIPERRVASVAAFAKALGAPLRTDTGKSLAVSIDNPEASRGLVEAIVHTAAGVFGAAAASISLIDQTTGELVYQSAWGAGARDIVGVRLPPEPGSAAASSRPACPRRFPTAVPIRASRPASPPAPAMFRTRCSWCRCSAGTARSARSRCSTDATGAATPMTTSSRRHCSPAWWSKRSTSLRCRSPASA